MALIKKVYGVKTPISPRIFTVHGVFDHHSKNPETSCHAFRIAPPPLTLTAIAACPQSKR